MSRAECVTLARCLWLDCGLLWAQIPTSPYEFVVLDCTLRRVFYVLPVAEPPLVKHPSTKLAEVLLSGYAVDNG